MTMGHTLRGFAVDRRTASNTAGPMVMMFGNINMNSAAASAAVPRRPEVRSSADK